MAEQQSPQTTNGDRTNGPRSELTRLGGTLLGLALIIGATNNETVKLAGQILPEMPAPGALAARALVGLVGAVLLGWGLWGVVAWPAWAGLLSRWQRNRAPQRPARDVGVPPDRNPFFSDRVIELGRLRERLVRERRVALSGMGGVGKSRLAIEYLHRHHDDPEHDDYKDGVFWLRGGEGAATLGDDFAALAWLPPLELDERHQREQARVIAAVAGWLRAHEHWLLVIDDLDEAAVPTLTILLGRGLKGHVLVTSRVSLWDSTPLEPMPPEVAVAFLLERSGQTDAVAAADVAEILGGLPLALVQAAGYLKNSGADLASYARLVRTRLGELLQEGRPEDYPLTVAATWRLSFEQIEREQPAAAALLSLCAFVAPDDIPLSVVSEGAAGLPEELRAVASDEVRLDRAVGELRRYALVDRQGDGLRVHRLVQAVVRDSMSTELRRRWLGATVRVLKNAFPATVEDPRSWPSCSRLLPHAQLAAHLVGEELVERRVISWLLGRVGRYLHVRGDYAAARSSLERALTIDERDLGPDHPRHR